MKSANKFNQQTRSPIDCLCCCFIEYAFCCGVSSVQSTRPILIHCNRLTSNAKFHPSISFCSTSKNHNTGFFSRHKCCNERPMRLERRYVRLQRYSSPAHACAISWHMSTCTCLSYWHCHSSHRTNFAWRTNWRQPSLSWVCHSGGVLKLLLEWRRVRHLSFINSRLFIAFILHSDNIMRIGSLH